MQCLYCETELKPLRGLFDEDFCCKEHREKYFASFRKGITLLPSLDLPPVTRKEQTISEEIAAEEVVERRFELVEEPEQVPEPVAMQAEPLEEPAAEEPLMAALAVEEPVMAAEPETVTEIEQPVLAAVQKPMLVAASVEAGLEDEIEEAEVTPRSADFLHLQVSPFGASDCYFMVEEDSFSACNGPAIPDVEVFCDAAFDPDDRQADVFATTEMVAAAPATGEGRRGNDAEPLATEGGQPAFRAWNYAAASLPELPTSELIADVEIFAAGAAPQEIARSTDVAPLPVAVVPAAVPVLQAAAVAAQPSVAEPASFDVACAQMEGAPLMFSDLPVMFEVHSPIFQVSAAAMELEEELKQAIEPPKTEAAKLAEPEIARPAVMSAAPVSRAVSTAGFQPTMPPTPARPEAPLNVPGIAAKGEAIPGMAAEVLADPPRHATPEQPPSAHSSDPVQPAIQNSVKIKNWRLKITFAKPA